MLFLISKEGDDEQQAVTSAAASLMRCTVNFQEGKSKNYMQPSAYI